MRRCQHGRAWHRCGTANSLQVARKFLHRPGLAWRPTVAGGAAAITICATLGTLTALAALAALATSATAALATLAAAERPEAIHPTLAPS